MTLKELHAKVGAVYNDTFAVEATSWHYAKERYSDAYDATYYEVWLARERRRLRASSPEMLVRLVEDLVNEDAPADVDLSEYA